MPLLSSGEIFVILLLMVKNSRKLDLKCLQDFFFKQVILYEIYRELSKCGKSFWLVFCKIPRDLYLWFFTLWGQDYPQVNRRSDISDSWLYDACLYDTKTILLLSFGEFYISKYWTVCYCRILSIQLLYWNDHLINIFSLDLIRALVKTKDR